MGRESNLPSERQAVIGATSIDPSAARTLAVLQPGYLPWLGFFDQILRSDVFVLYDDVQFDKHGWRNRNRVKGRRGPQWLTVPIHHRRRGQQRILDIEINNGTSWARKHIATIRHLYARAPFLSTYLPELADLLRGDWKRLVDLDVAVIQLMTRWLDIRRPVLRASELGVPGARNERLVALCRSVGATDYLSGDAARAYLDVSLFEANGIRVHWQRYSHPVYPQLHGDFISHLSALDLLLNCGPESTAILRHTGGG